MISRTEQSIVERFEAVWQTVRHQPEPLLIPPINIQLFNHQNRQSMFNFACDIWGETFDRTKLTTYLDPTTSPQNQDHVELKTIRKYGAILKSGYLLFDQRHSTPVPLYQFVKVLGELNDYYFTPDASKHKTQTLSALEQLPDPESPPDFEPATDESFLEAWNYSLNRAKTGTKLEPIQITDFHNTRKSLRYIMNALRLSMFLDDNPNHQSLLKCLSRINEELGDIHDQLVTQAYAGKIDYYQATATIPESTYQRIIAVGSALTVNALSR